jgi:hypothetical protein
MVGDKAIKALEARLKAKTIKGPEAIELLAKVLPLLRRRTAKLAELTAFVNEVSDEDRLYLPAWSIWRRKLIDKGKTVWARANPPDAPAAAPATPPATVDRTRVGVLGGTGQVP